MFHQQLNAIAIHGNLTPDTFTVPPNMRIISYACPLSLVYSSAPIFQCFRQSAQTIDQIAYEMSFYPHAMLDFCVHEPGDKINDINIVFGGPQDQWKMGVFLPNSNKIPYSPTTVSNYLKHRTLATTEANRIVACGHPSFIPLSNTEKQYWSGNYHIELFQGPERLSALVQYISQSHPFDEMINFIVWTCKGGSYGNTAFGRASFVPGRPLIQYIPNSFVTKTDTEYVIWDNNLQLLFEIPYAKPVGDSRHVVVHLLVLPMTQAAPESLIRQCILTIIREVMIENAGTLRQIVYSFRVYMMRDSIDNIFLILFRKVMESMEFQYDVLRPSADAMEVELPKPHCAKYKMTKSYLRAGQRRSWSRRSHKYLKVKYGSRGGRYVTRKKCIEYYTPQKLMALDVVRTYLESGIVLKPMDVFVFSHELCQRFMHTDAPFPFRSRKPCRNDQIRNPKTQRCVKRSGRIGRSLVDCSPDKIRNPATGRCVLKDGKIGRAIRSRSRRRRSR